MSSWKLFYLAQLQVMDKIMITAHYTAVITL